MPGPVVRFKIIGAGPGHAPATSGSGPGGASPQHLGRRGLINRPVRGAVSCQRSNSSTVGIRWFLPSNAGRKPPACLASPDSRRAAFAASARVKASCRWHQNSTAYHGHTAPGLTGAVSGGHPHRWPRRITFATRGAVPVGAGVAPATPDPSRGQPALARRGAWSIRASMRARMVSSTGMPSQTTGAQAPAM